MRLLIILIAMLAVSDSFAANTAMPDLPHAISLQADFTQTHYLPALKEPLITHGQLSINKTGFTWQVNQPYRYTYRMQNGKMIEIDSQGRKKIITTKQAPWIVPIKNLFTALLSADIKKLKPLFLITRKPSDNGILLTMQPRSKAMRQAITRVQVWHSPWPDRILIHETGGGRLEIDLEITHIVPAKDSQAQ